MSKPQTLYATPTKVNTGTDIVDKPTSDYSGVAKETAAFSVVTKPTSAYSESSKSTTAHAGTSKPTGAFDLIAKPTTSHVFNPNYSSSLYVDSEQSYNDSAVTYLGNDGTEQAFTIKDPNSFTDGQKNTTGSTATTKPTTEYS